jgi:hypothetical protein
MRELMRQPEIPEPLRTAVAARIEPPVVFVPPTWEYRDVVRRVPQESPLRESELNALGAEGWELVSVYAEGGAVHFYLKRAVS